MSPDRVDTDPMTRDKTVADRLRALHKISVQITSQERIDDVYVMTVRATMPDGRIDEEIGAVNIKNLTGDALANAYMKTLTKAKCRVTFALCGLGWLDESESEQASNEIWTQPPPETPTKPPPVREPAPPAPPAPPGRNGTSTTIQKTSKVDWINWQTFWGHLKGTEGMTEVDVHQILGGSASEYARAHSDLRTTDLINRVIDLRDGLYHELAEETDGDV